MPGLDVFKVIAVILIFVFLNRLVRPPDRSRYYWLMQIGLLLFFTGAILDTADEICFMNNFVIIGRNACYHDFLEDQVCDLLGFICFSIGAMGLIAKKK